MRCKTEHRHTAMVRAGESPDKLEQRGLPSAVWAHETKDLAWADDEAERAEPEANTMTLRKCFGADNVHSQACYQAESTSISPPKTKAPPSARPEPRAPAMKASATSVPNCFSRYG